MLKFLSYSFAFLLVALLLCRCIISKTRWSDSKAHAVFNKRGVTLSIHDTIINNHHLHYAVTGNEKLPTLVFIHGSPGSWFHYMKYLWDSVLLTKFRMVSIDRPGFGFSDYGNAMHLQEQCEIVLPVLKSLKTTEPMYVCGHSFGGPVVAELAASAPQLFSKIILVAAALDPGLEKKETWRHIVDKKPMFWFLPGAFQQSNTELLYLKKDLIPLAKDFTKITCPIIFIHGDKDTWVPIENISYGKKLMTNAASITIDTLHGADHQIPWKNRDDLKTILLNLY